MEELRVGDEDEVQFGLKEIVWAKIIGYPRWPARITQIPSSRNPYYRVDFFNDHTHAFLAAGKIDKYEDMREHIDLHRHMNKGLRKAIAEADKLFSEEGAVPAPSQRLQKAVEEPLLKQKQLSKSPQATTPLLQQHTNLPGAQHLLSDIDEDESSEEPEEDEEEEEPVQPHLRYSRQQREKYVSTLLKKYRLVSIPRTEDSLPSKKYTEKSTHRSSKRRSSSGRKTAEPKSKPISKMPYQEHSFFYLLARKIHGMLKTKEGLEAQQWKLISSTLAKEVLSGGLEEVNGLFKWVSLSSACTIANFYQNWGCMQGEKEKSSNMTLEE